MFAINTIYMVHKDNIFNYQAYDYFNTTAIIQ